MNDDRFIYLDFGLKPRSHMQEAAAIVLDKMRGDLDMSNPLEAIAERTGIPLALLEFYELYYQLMYGDFVMEYGPNSVRLGTSGDYSITIEDGQQVWRRNDGPGFRSRRG